MASKARAYAEQARSDFGAYMALQEAAEPVLGEHLRLQLLQMALDKLAKAYLYYAEPEATYSHHVALSALNRVRSYRVAEAAGMKFRPFSRMLDLAKPVFLQIEAASPSTGYDGKGLTRAQSERTANVEYPWQVDAPNPDSWVVPATHRFPIAHSLRFDRNAVMAVRLLGRLIEAADTILPRP